jgi:response regulator RpfG family c-di-GMP phosphodiesterase
MPRVLCVDDDAHVLGALARVLRPGFDVQTAATPAEALLLMEHTADPFAVIISDLAMPGMDGIALLARSREVAPSTIRVLLTGNADIPAAIEAVNTGAIFRFLTKPCRPNTLTVAVAAAVAQYRLVESERVLLEQTLRGAVNALIDVLTVASPSAFARGVRLKRYVGQISDVLGVHDGWDVEVAALISQLGCVSLPPTLLEKMHAGASLEPNEQALVDGLPAAAVAFIADIPRLDTVREILRHQNTDFSADDARRPGTTSSKIPLGARMLRAAGDFDRLLTSGMPASLALGNLGARQKMYDPRVLDALRRAVSGEGEPEVRRVRFRDIREGMVFASDVIGPNGLLLGARGQEVGPALMSRLRHQGNDALLDAEVSVCDRAEYLNVSDS